MTTQYKLDISDQYLWLDENEPNMTGSGDPKEKSGQWELLTTEL